MDFDRTFLIAKYSYSTDSNMGTYHYTVEMSPISFVSAILMVLFAPKLMIAIIVMSMIATIPNVQEKFRHCCHNVLQWSKANVPILVSQFSSSKDSSKHAETQHDVPDDDFHLPPHLEESSSASQDFPAANVDTFVEDNTSEDRDKVNFRARPAVVE